MKGSDFPDIQHVNDYINAGLSELHDMLVQSYSDYLMKITTIPIVPGTEAYALPSDFLKARKVFYTSGDRRFPMERFNEDEIGGYRSSPVGGGDIEVWYIPQFTKLTDDDSTVDVSVPIGWEDFVCLHAAVRLLMREESDATPLMQEREIQRNKIVNAAEPRDAGQASRVGDYYGRWNDAQELFNQERRYLRYNVLGDYIRFIEYEYLGL
jgi:hypothetical protein